MTNNDARGSKLSRVLTIAQTSILMLGLVFMSMPTTAMATAPEIPNLPDYPDTSFYFPLPQLPVELALGGTLIVNKTVNGSNASPSTFGFSVKTLTLTGFTTTHYVFENDGSNSIVLPFGLFWVKEDAAPGYTTSYNTCKGAMFPLTEGEMIASFLGTAVTRTCNVTNTAVVVDDEDPEVPQTCNIYSDTTTLADGNPSLATYVHAGWTSIPGATWIWKTLLVDTNLVPDTTTFTKSINLSGVPSSATLTIAADNTYTVLVNGVPPTCDGSQIDNFSGSETCPVTNLVAGNNTLTFTVTNTAGDPLPQDNPAGLDYKLEIVGATCNPVIPPPPNTIQVHILKYIQDGQTFAAATGSLPDFPMVATWNAVNIGGGTGNYPLGAAGYYGSDPYEADTSAMSIPADYTTHEVPNGDTVIANDATCSPGKYRLLGYKTGDSLATALTDETDLATPTFTGLTADKYIIVVNEKCPPAPVDMCLNINGNQASVPEGYTANNDHICTPTNTCVMPTAGEVAPHVSIGDSGEDTVQEVLDANGYTLNADTDQDNFQVWTGTGNSVNFTVSPLAHLSGYTHVFGYYVNNDLNTFVGIMSNGVVPAPYAALPTTAQNFTVNPVSASGVGFAVKAYDGSLNLVGTYATQQSLNTGSAQRAVVYNPSGNEYVLGFDDQMTSPDGDYNDTMVVVDVTGCQSPITCNPETELLTNGGFESPAISASDWDIVPSGTLGLDWLVNWLNPSGAPATANAEFQKNVGWSPFAGLQYVELDSDWNGHIGSLDGESSSVSMEQTVPTVPGQTYTFSYQFSPRPGTGASENSVQATVNGSPIGTSGPADGTANSNTVWSTQSFSFVATGASTVVGLRDAGTSNSSGSLVDNASLRCTPQEQPQTATIHAQKVICNSEAALPNMSGSESNITATTAADWVAQSNGACHLADWDFQWAPSTATNPGDNVTGLPTGWTSFIGGMASVPAGALVWVRENIDPAYIPFSGAETNSPVSAEVYCNADVLNYDNLDYVDPVVAGQHYYCVAFNAPVDEVPTDDSHGPVQTFSGSSGSGDSNSSSDGNGDVLGESTETCEALLTDYLKIGWANNPEQVKKLQGFLAEHLGNSLPVTGFFGPLTFGAVKVFQSEDWEDILKPWISVPGSGITGQDTPTGFVYKTTKWHINNIVCPGSEEFPTNLD